MRTPGCRATYHSNRLIVEKLHRRPFHIVNVKMLAGHNFMAKGPPVGHPWCRQCHVHNYQHHVTYLNNSQLSPVCSLHIMLMKAKGHIQRERETNYLRVCMKKYVCTTAIDRTLWP